MADQKISITIPEGLEFIHLSTDSPKKNNELAHEHCEQFTLGKDGELIRKGAGVRVKLLPGYVARFVSQLHQYRAVKHYGAEGKMIQVRVYDDAQALTVSEVAKSFKADTIHGQ